MDLAAQLYFESVLAVRWRRAGAGFSPRPKLASVWGSVVANSGVRRFGVFRLRADVSEQFYLLWCFARHGGDAGDRSAYRVLGPLVMAFGGLGVGHLLLNALGV